MKTQTSATVSKLYNRPVNDSPSAEPARLKEEDIQRGRYRRACEIIEEARGLGIELTEIWEDA
jgi:hypothetical protein